MKDRVELLAPAGDLEKLKMAIEYGADAIYLGGENFGLRTASKNFTIDNIKKGVIYAHERYKKVYVTLNIIPHNEDLVGLEDYIKDLHKISVDAVIVSDPGIFSIIKRTIPEMEVHLSTQASVTNYETIMFWYDLGIRRIVLARELSLKEIKEIRERVPEDLELEAFVHGAMCMSYSGRCLISNYMTGRDANRGDCSHACRYKYNLVEEKRPGEYYPVFEDEGGTFIMNSKDLCMIEHLEELIDVGINSFKIEGRVKSSYYVATVIRSYRMALDNYYENPEKYKYNEKWLEEIKKASHRDFTKGFYYGDPGESGQLYETSSYIRNYNFLGIVLDYDEENNSATVEQRNRIFLGDEVEIFGPNEDYYTQRIEKMWNDEGEKIDVAPHAQQIIKIKTDKKVKPMSMLRMVRKGE